MSFLEAKSDKEFVSKFIEEANEFMRIESEAELKLRPSSYLSSNEIQKYLQAECSKIDNYSNLRDTISKKVLRMRNLARKHNVPNVFQSIPPAMVGGAIIPVNIIYALLFDNSYQRVDRQMIWDCLMQIEGACENHYDKELKRLINPVNWVFEILSFIIRIPFILIETSGFNVSKVEDHILGKSFKVLSIAVIAYVLLRLGFKKEDLMSVVAKLF